MCLPAGSLAPALEAETLIMTEHGYDLLAEAPWSSGDWKPPASAMRVPTMLSEEEGCLLYWLGANWVTGAGAVCDLGCFAGGSTARLAAGLADSSTEAPVHAYDFFTISPQHKEKFLYSNGVRRFWGRNLLPTVRRLLKPWSGRVTFHKTDIVDARWSSGPIEVLFVDVMKSPEAADAVGKTFYPSLLPGRSVLVHQDYQHWRQPWIAAQMELLRPAFRPIAWADQGTVVFAVDDVPDPALSRSASVSSLSDDRMIELVKSAISRAATRSARHQLARAVLGLKDNPGCRTPFRFDPRPINGARVRALLGECENLEEPAIRRR